MSVAQGPEEIPRLKSLLNNLLQDLINDQRVVRVTAADFNGTSFDGSPIVPVHGTENPEWLIKALKDRQIRISMDGGTDYATFIMLSHSGQVVRAGPGDYIVQRTKDTFLVLDGEFLTMINCENLQELAQQQLAGISAIKAQTPTS